MANIMPTAAISGWPSGVFGRISAVVSMQEPKNSTLANIARTMFLTVAFRPYRISS